MVDGLIRLEIVISIKGNKKESSEGNILRKGPIKDRKKGGAKNRLSVRGQGTKTRKDLRVRRSNNTEPNLLTKSKKQAFNKRERSGNVNSQRPLKSNFIAQETRFGAKTDSSKGYKRVQVRNSNSNSEESYQPLTGEQKERLGRLLEAHLGIGL